MFSSNVLLALSVILILSRLHSKYSWVSNSILSFLTPNGYALEQIKILINIDSQDLDLHLNSGECKMYFCLISQHGKITCVFP